MVSLSMKQNVPLLHGNFRNVFVASPDSSRSVKTLKKYIFFPWKGAAPYLITIWMPFGGLQSNVPLLKERGTILRSWNWQAKRIHGLLAFKLISLSSLEMIPKCLHSKISRRKKEHTTEEEKQRYLQCWEPACHPPLQSQRYAAHITCN